MDQDYIMRMVVQVNTFICRKMRLVTTNKKALKTICKNYSVALAYLFGSQAEEGLKLLNGENVRPVDSMADLDLAIVFNKNLPPSNQLPGFYADLYNQLADIFLPYSLDLVFLQEQHSVFQAQVVTGICIYAENETFKGDYEEDVMRRAADFKPFLEKFFEERLERL